MILHLFANDKFVKDFIDKINQLFGENNHEFIIFPAESKYFKRGDIVYSNVSFADLSNIRKELKQKFKSVDRVIIHGFFMGVKDNIYIYHYLKKYSIKLIWCVWGADLYNQYDYNHTFKNILKIKPIINEYYRKKIIKSMYMIISGCDDEEVIKRYNTNARQLGAHYTYHLIDSKEIECHEMINVMVGHSATDTCRHIDTFELLKPYIGKIKVYCPLSYPDDSVYIDKVCSAGRKIFGDDFVPMLDFIQYDEYVRFLNRMDIGVFNNNRQQGNGNITNMLYLGKKVYLSKDNTIRKFYIGTECLIFDTDDIRDGTFTTLLSEKQRKLNKDFIEREYSDETFYENWNRIFTE